MVTDFKTNSEKVREFTEQSLGKKLPEFPEAMSTAEVNFITKMVIDELLELLATVYTSTDAKELITNITTEAKELEHGHYDTDIAKIAEQADAFVDIEIYLKNAAAKKGINVDKIFNAVHDANMAKKDPDTGKFIKRADGKIMKPQNWTEPDIEGIIYKQFKEGSFTKDGE